jgi:hypothetical protein
MYNNKNFDLWHHEMGMGICFDNSESRVTFMKSFIQTKRNNPVSTALLPIILRRLHEIQVK